MVKPVRISFDIWFQAFMIVSMHVNVFIVTKHRSRLCIRPRMLSSFQLSLPTGQDKDKTRDTVYIGCCSLRVEHLKLYQSNHVIKFEYPGNLGEMCHKKAQVDERVFNSVQRNMTSKIHGDHLFDKINVRS